jgi:hypothetical protein
MSPERMTPTALSALVIRETCAECTNKAKDQANHSFVAFVSEQFVIEPFGDLLFWESHHTIELIQTRVLNAATNRNYRVPVSNTEPV